MPIKKTWINPGETRVITPEGYAAVVAVDENAGRCSVVLDEAWAGSKESNFSFGEITLATDFAMVNIINLSLDGIVPHLIASAINYPTKDELAKELLGWPYAQDETLVGLDFTTQKIIHNRTWPTIGRYRITQAYYDMHSGAEVFVTDELEEAKNFWLDRIERLGGTSGHILLCIFVDMEEGIILARALFSTTKVLEYQKWFSAELEKIQEAPKLLPLNE